MILTWQVNSPDDTVSPTRSPALTKFLEISKLLSLIFLSGALFEIQQTAFITPRLRENRTKESLVVRLFS